MIKNMSNNKKENLLVECEKIYNLLNN